MGYRLGIDLGTTFTAAAYIEDADPRMLELANRNLTMPSVLFVAEDGRLLFGETAERRSSAEPERVLREFKRRVGDTVPMVVGQRTFDPTALQSELLRWVLKVAGERLGGPPDHVVVTYPANWGLFKIQLMRDIAAAAGIPGASLCPEPVAAAIEYAAKQRVPIGAKVAVYDLGGGTFDVAVLEKTAEGFEIIGTPLGVDHLGGSDFDEAILADTASKLGLHGLDPDDPAVGRGLAALRRECIEAKETLSSDVSTDITSLLPGADRPVRLTRGEFEGLIRPALEESIRTTVRALRLAGVDNQDLYAVVLVGGSSRIPLVSELINRELAVPVAADTFPKHDIALGAARYALLQASAPVDPVTETAPLAPSEQGPATRPAGSTTAPDPATATTPPAPTTPVPDASQPDASQPDASQPDAAARAPEVLLSSTGGHGEPAYTTQDKRGRRIRSGLIVAIVVIGLAVGAGIVTLIVRSTGRQAAPASQGSVAPSGQPSSAAHDQEALDLPVGSPLPATQMVAPRYLKAGAATQLWLVDSVDPSASTHIDAVKDGSAYTIGMSTDRRTITYIDTGTNAIRAMPAVGGTGRRLFTSPDGCGAIAHVSWSPTDLAVFVLECRLGSGPRRLVVVDIEGKIIRQLDTGSLHPANPTISPDGTMVAFEVTDAEAGGKRGSIFVMPIDGSAQPSPVTDNTAGLDTDPAWSPDGTTLAFGRSGGPKAGNGDILVVPAAGGTPRTVVSGPATDEKPTWSPDGRTIAFVSDRDTDGSKTDHQDLWLAPAAGGKPTPLGLESYRYATPTWWHR